MKKVVQILLVIISVFAMQSICIAKKGNEKIADVKKYRGTKILIGTEGGASKSRDETVILKSGQIFTHNIEKDEYKYLKTLTGRETRKVFSMFNGVPKSSFNHPGPPSSFVEQDHNGNISYYYIWGEQGIEVPEYILSGYAEILKIIR